MEIFTLICLALSLSADAFVTAVCDGMAYRPKLVKRLVVAVTFGVAQGVMPILGALLGEKLLSFSQMQDYIAFAALFVVGILMLIDSFEKTQKAKKSFGVATVLFQAIATSIDAFTCGLTLTTMSFALWIDGLVIGGITAILCTLGICFATGIGKRFAHPQRFKLIGGSILIALALKNLIYCFI